MEYLVSIGFLDINFWDILDILICGFLLFRIYKLLRGSLALNILVGLLLLYIIWFVVDLLDMELLSLILTQFVNVGVILLLIVFQPEVRRFLLYLGRGTLKRRSGWYSKLFGEGLELSEGKLHSINDLLLAIDQLSASKTGALMVFTTDTNLQGLSNSGVVLNAQISTPLITSIFQKDTPLHDGAMIINDNRIFAARVVLPVSERIDLPKHVGLRHRAAVGITEGTDTASVIVSEETGKISFAKEGKLEIGINRTALEQNLKEIFREFYE